MHLVAWSTNMTPEESKYKSQGFSKTAGTVFIEPPSNEILKQAFNEIDANSEFSIGARFLNKFCDRNEITFDGNTVHKNETASDFIDSFLDSEITWKNIHMMDKKHIILELRNDICGLRWYISESPVRFRGVLDPYDTYLEFKEKLIGLKNLFK